MGVLNTIRSISLDRIDPVQIVVAGGTAALVYGRTFCRKERSAIDANGQTGRDGIAAFSCRAEMGDRVDRWSVEPIVTSGISRVIERVGPEQVLRCRVSIVSRPRKIQA